ncbi:ABC transporter permease [Curvivirga sp.]|uniref:ABC transporter permease n=1 Tax=Curvivirga sp. TaxID=2856848 RepID=UPI003B59EEAF
MWLLLFIASLILAANAKGWSKILGMKWAMKYPAGWRLPLKSHITNGMEWLVEEASFGLFTFKEFTRGIAYLLELPLDFSTAIFSTGFYSGLGNEAVQVLPPISWIAVIIIVFAIGHFARAMKLTPAKMSLAIFAMLCFLYLAVFGQWESSMITLSSIVIAVPMGVIGGVLIGTCGYRWPKFEKAISPLLDLMQTMPIFAYLVPILFLFGFGPVAAMIATVIYAMPPMVRITIMALKNVPSEIVDFGYMAGCTRRQLMWKVLVPSAAPGLMVGVNQVIMLSLNMVIIASMIGAGGLGYDVLTSLRRLDIGGGLEAGVAIVVLAIALDRLSQAFAEQNDMALVHHHAQKPFLKRHQWSLISGVAILFFGIGGYVIDAFQMYPESWEVTTASFWEASVKYLNVNFYDQFEALKTALLTTFMIPVKRFLLGLPWPWVCAMLALIGWQLGGWRLSLLCAVLSLFIVVTGQWQKAMITVYLCSISVVIAGLIGVPLGILAAEKPTANRIIQGAIDTLQTLPSFVYLIPVVMLFRVGDFAAMIAVVLYALAPAVRYTIHGLRQIDPSLIEAGIVSGCTKRQLLWKVKLPIAVPEILLGMNQTVMLAISMLVITALVGTRDLGQEVYIALTKADTGRGLIAGLSIAFIAIIADRLINAGAKKLRQHHH